MDNDQVTLQQDAPGAGDGSGEGDGASSSEVSTQALLEKMDRLENALRTTQGQAHRAEAQVTALQSLVGSLAQARQEGRPPSAKALGRAEAAINRLAADDPARGILQDVLEDVRGELDGMRGEVGQVRGHVVRQQFSQAEQADRDNCIRVLERNAKLAGLDFDTVRAEIEGLPTSGMYDAGLAVLEKVRAGGNANARLKDLKERGLYTERRPGTTGSAPGGKGTLTPNDLRAMSAEQVAALDLSESDIAGIMRRGRGG